MLQYDRTPLHIAAEKGQTKIVDILTEKFKTSVAARTKVPFNYFVNQLMMSILKYSPKLYHI